MRQDIIDWITLSRIPGVGTLRFQFLIDSFDLPSNVFKASSHELLQIKGIDKKTAQSIIENLDLAKEKSMKDFQIIQENGFQVVTYKDNEYPLNLANIHNRPPLLYIKGNLLPQDHLAVGIVGSRHSTTYGVLMAKKLAEDLASNGVTIISGMARGIDTASHRGALEANGRTYAVLGCGLDICYPKENLELKNQISQNGAVISEFPMGTPPEAQNFPVRNRIISGLSLGIVIVEANEKSGALITADYALQQGREVFAVPGNATVETSRGTNKLIKQGAKLVTGAVDILEEISPTTRIVKKDSLEVISVQVDLNLSKPENKIMDVLTDEPMHVDIISQLTGINISDLSQYLLNLELLGKITQLTGKRFVKSL